jgi:hypothetical protein
MLSWVAVLPLQDAFSFSCKTCSSSIYGANSQHIHGSCHVSAAASPHPVHLNPCASLFDAAALQTGSHS